MPGPGLVNVWQQKRVPTTKMTAKEEAKMRLLNSWIKGSEIVKEIEPNWLVKFSSCHAKKENHCNKGVRCHAMVQHTK